MAAGMRAAAGAAVTDSDGRSVRSGGGLRNLGGQGGQGGGSAAGDRPSGGGSSGGGGSAGPGGGGGRPSAGGPVAGGEGAGGPTGDALGDGALAVGGATTGAGSIAVAAGASTQAPTASQGGSDHASARGTQGNPGTSAPTGRISPGAQPAGADEDAAVLRGPTRAPSPTTGRDAGDEPGNERPAQPHIARGGSRVPGADAGVPQQSSDAAVSLPRQPRRRPARRSPALSGSAPPPRPQRPKDGAR